MTKKANKRASTAQTKQKKTVSKGSIHPRHKAFAQEYVTGARDKKNQLNGTRTVKEIYNTDNDNVAAVHASRLLRNDKVKNEIEVLMDSHGLSVSECLKVNKRNMLQEKHLPTSQKAAETGLKIHGLIDSEATKTQVNVALVIE